MNIHTVKKMVIADFQLCRFVYGCGEGVRKQKKCVRDVCIKCWCVGPRVGCPCLYLPGRSVTDAPQVEGSSSVQRKVHPAVNRLFCYQGTLALSHSRLSLPLWPFSLIFLAVSNQATLTTLCIKHWAWVVFTFIATIPVRRLVSGAFFLLELNDCHLWSII